MRKLLAGHIKYLLLAIGILIHSGPCLAFSEEYKEGDFAKTVALLLNKDIPYGDAQCWILDYNGFAVKVPTALMIFDYSNDQTPPKYDFDARRTVEGRLENSLLTGAIDPEEIKDENVIVFFSHEHPAEMLPAALEWRNKIKNIQYIIAEDVYNTHKSYIDQLREKDMSGESGIIGKTDIMDLIKIVRPNMVVSVSGVTVNTVASEYILDPTSRKKYPGVEFIIEANGATIYHSGSFSCHRCIEEAPETGKYIVERPKVITKDTEKIVFQNGRIVKINDEQADRIDHVLKTSKRVAISLHSAFTTATTKIFIAHGVYGDWGNEDAPMPTAVTYGIGEALPELADFNVGNAEKWFSDLQGNWGIVDKLKTLSTEVASYYSLVASDIEVTPFRTFRVLKSNNRLRGGCYLLSNKTPICYFYGYFMNRGYSPSGDPRKLLYEGR